MFKPLIVLLALVCVVSAATVAPKIRIITVVKADTITTIKPDTVRTVIFDTTKIVQTLKDTVIVSKADTLKSKSKPQMLKK